MPCSVSISSLDGRSHAHPNVRVLEHTAQSPEVIVCNPNSDGGGAGNGTGTLSFTIQYANSSFAVSLRLAMALMATVLLLHSESLAL
ncbi:MAG: hypothetical protein MHM6MM_002396 [Cercozoa sp. M6MM]